MDNETLAMEIIRELKAQNKRMFIALIFEGAIIILWVIATFWYFSLPADEISIENDDGNANYIGNNLEGGLYNGKDYSQEESGS